MADASGSMDSRIDNYLLYTHFTWEVTYDLNNMKANWTVSATIKRSYENPSVSKNYASSVKGSTPDNYIKFNGTAVWTASEGSYQGNSLHPYVYTGDQSVCAETTAGPYSGTLAGKYPYGYCHLLQGYQYSTDINDNGGTSLTITGKLTDVGNTTTPSGEDPFSYTISTGNGRIPVADIFSKVKTVKNSTGNWADGGYIWLKENDGWKKKKIYRKDNNTGTTSDWVKK